MSAEFRARILKTATDLANLCADKNEAYGSSFAKSGNILKEMYPDGIKPEQYDDMLAVVRVLDKLFRIATRKDAFGESPWNDVTGYGLLKSEIDASKKKSPSGYRARVGDRVRTVGSNLGDRELVVAEVLPIGVKDKDGLYAAHGFYALVEPAK